jgi:hypothetical protein
MLTEEERVQDLVRQMHERAIHAPWSLSAEDVRSQPRRRALQLADPKLLGLAAAAIVVILLAVLVGTGVGSGGHKSHPLAVPPSTTTTPPAPSTTTTTNSTARVIVPDLLGENETQATSTLATLGLTVARISVAPSASAAGTVISQAPSIGSAVAPGSSVTLTVSSGPSATPTAATNASPNGPVQIDAAFGIATPAQAEPGGAPGEGTDPVPQPVAVPGSPTQPPLGPSPLQAITAPAALPYPANWVPANGASSRVQVARAQAAR